MLGLPETEINIRCKQDFRERALSHLPCEVLLQDGSSLEASTSGGWITPLARAHEAPPPVSAAAAHLHLKGPH